MRYYRFLGCCPDRFLKYSRIRNTDGINKPVSRECLEIEAGRIHLLSYQWVRHNRFPRSEERSDIAMPYAIDGGYLGLHLNFKVLTRYNDDMISDHAYDTTIYAKAFSRL